MKTKWILLLCLAVLAVEANAEQSADPQSEANAVNKERVLRGGKMSPMQRAAVTKAAITETNEQTSDSYLATNLVKPGVIGLPSGVQYKILKAGTGKKPTEQSMVRCRYQGRLIDGSTFDKNDEKTPATMAVTGFLPGLKEAVKLMPAGSKWEVVVPPQLAYGAQGNHHVGPNAVLIYDMEIVSIK